MKSTRLIPGLGFWLGLALVALGATLAGQSSTQTTGIQASGTQAAGRPISQNSTAIAPVQIRVIGEKGAVIANSWAIPLGGGYVTVRGVLAGAHKAEIVEGERSQTVTHVRGEDIERNLLYVVTALEPESGANPSSIVVTEPEPWRIVCQQSESIPLNEMRVRDLPVFGLVYMGKTAHGDAIGGCPVWNDEQKWSGIVVWESPMARPSVAIVPALLAKPLESAPEQSWDQWRGKQAAEGARFRNSLILEGLQDIWREQYSSAIGTLSLLVEKNQRDGRAWYYRGYAKAMSGDRNGSMEDYEQAVLYEPDNADAHFSLGFTYLLLRRSLEAMEQAKALDEIDEVMAQKLRLLIDAMSESPERDAGYPEVVVPDPGTPQQENP